MCKVSTAMLQDQLFYLLSPKLWLFFQVLYRLLPTHQSPSTYILLLTYRLQPIYTLLYNLVPYISLQIPLFLPLYRNKQMQGLLLSSKKQNQIQQLLKPVDFAKTRKIVLKLPKSNLEQLLLLFSKIKQTRRNLQVRFPPPH